MIPRQPTLPDRQQPRREVATIARHDLDADRLRLEMATSATAPVTARVLDRNGTPMPVQPQVSERSDPSTQFKWAVIDVALAPFAAGDYAIEAAQGQARQVTAFRVIP